MVSPIVSTTDMLEHLTLHDVKHLEDAIPLIGTEWTMFRFPIHKSSKAAMYGRLWKLRALGIDCVVREYERRFLLIARKEHENDNRTQEVQLS